MCKLIMKRTILFLAMALTALLLAGCGQQRSQAYYDYESKVIQAHNDGSYVIRAWGRSRNAAMSYDVAQIQALQDVIFKGVQPASSNIQPLKPLCFDMNAREKYEDYWTAFFSDNGPWKEFTSYKDRRAVTTHYERDGRQMVETGTVTIDRAALKKKLQADGIIPAQGRY